MKITKTMMLVLLVAFLLPGVVFSDEQTPEVVGEPNKIEDISETWIRERIKSYSGALENIKNRRRASEEDLENIKKVESEIKGHIDELDAVRKDLKSRKIWMVDQKEMGVIAEIPEEVSA